MKLRKSYIILTILSIIFFISSYAIYLNEEKKLNKEIEAYTKKQKIIIEDYFNISKTILYSYKNLFENKPQIKIQKHPSLLNIEQYTKDTYNIQNKISETYNSTIYGIGKIEEFSSNLENEINTVLYFDSLFKTALDILPDIKWIYFSSKQKYIYLAPSKLKANKTFIESQFKKNFWIEAIPVNNKSNELLLTKLYKDGLSYEILTTLSLPIFDKSSEFIGIVSIDIGLKIFDKIFNEHKNISGNTYLINHNNYILASTTSFNKDLQLNLTQKEYKVQDISNNKIKLVYIENPRKKHSLIINKSMSKILLLLFLLSIIYLSYHLTYLLNKVERLANYDSLTNLLNRRALRYEASKYIELSKRYKDNISLILIDIDDFKTINDTFGHANGDLVLKSISNTLISSARKTDLVSRYGGEEFLIVLPHTNLNNAYLQAERIRKEVLKINFSNIKKNITISLGCVEFNPKKDCLDSAIHRADILLYEAKEKGKNQTRY